MSNNNEPEDLVKWSKSVESAGRSAEALGWIAIVIAGVTPWLLTYKIPTARIGASFLTFLLGLYFIGTGKYIRNTTGTKVRLLLYLNGFVSLLLFRGIIPLFVCIESFSGAGKYTKLQKVADIHFTNRFPISNREKLFFTLLIIAVVISGYFAFHAPMTTQ